MCLKISAKIRHTTDPVQPSEVTRLQVTGATRTNPGWVARICINATQNIRTSSRKDRALDQKAALPRARVCHPAARAGRRTHVPRRHVAGAVPSRPRFPIFIEIRRTREENLRVRIGRIID
ncbi:hypothetical protein EVAR_96807_1 [Eumeta japonica]|uniref:Uncharacterized protein n=1 Tax=Eumeta variegata TaxID=151549 RepID=A0A4C1WA05_EUMVA|nr:hypothetical protein EVAR_96807_1 [Eumeta japonica]